MRLFRHCKRPQPASHLALLTTGIWILTSGISPAILDSNENGLSDFWERHHNSGELFPETFNPQADPDADGWTNLEEAIAGTDPFFPNPPEGIIRPDIVHIPAVMGEENGVPVLVSPAFITVSWPTLTGKLYRLQFSPDLGAQSWLPVGASFIAQGGVSEYNLDVGISDRRFWRVAVEDTDTDADGLTNHEENLYGTDSALPMSFSGVPDAWLAEHFPNLGNFEPDGDPDGDGIGNRLEQQLGLNPNGPDLLGLVNLGFEGEISDSPTLSFREEYPSDVYEHGSFNGWRAALGDHIEIWDEGDGNPYAELQSHFGSHGLKQEFDMLPGATLSFILRYKGRYEFGAENAFDLKVAGAARLLTDGVPVAESSATRSRDFMEDDEWEKYVEWQYAAVTITAPSGVVDLKRITLSLVPQNTTETGEEITYGGFVDLLPVETAPGTLASNGDFDEGAIGSTGAQETGAIADSRNHTLVAARNSVDGRVSAGDVVTEDLHQGWFGLRPGVIPDDFFEGATVTITKLSKFDSETGKIESGEVRFFATWGINEELMLQTDDPYIDQLLANNPAPRNLVGKVYGANKTVPADAKFWIEGISPGKITLEFRIQKGSTDLRHEQTFEIRNNWTRDQWLAVIRDEIYIDSFTTSGGPARNGFNSTGIDINQYVVANDFLSNRPYIYSVYEYYAKLHTRGDGQTATGGGDKFLWAGLAKLAGAPVYGGMSDAQNGRGGLEIGSFGVINGEILKGIQDLLVNANIRIYNDLAYQFVAYRTGGLKSIEHLKKLNTLDVTTYNAWKAIAEGGPAEIANANEVLLRREQEIILADTYTDLLSLWDGWIADAFSWLTTNPIVGGPSFQTVIPNGNIAVFADRWGWITHSQQGMWLLWTSKDKSERQGLANRPLRINATNFAYFSRLSLAPLQ